jgi:hypothetical protein
MADGNGQRTTQRGLPHSKTIHNSAATSMHTRAHEPVYAHSHAHWHNHIGTRPGTLTPTHGTHTGTASGTHLHTGQTHTNIHTTLLNALATHDGLPHRAAAGSPNASPGPLDGPNTEAGRRQNRRPACRQIVRRVPWFRATLRQATPIHRWLALEM